MSKKSMIATVLAAALMATVSVASAQQMNPQERFKAADKDGNGMLSKEEASAGMPRVAERFDELDTNKDGQLSLEELRAGRKQRN